MTTRLSKSRLMEQRVSNGLAAEFPDLDPALRGLAGRLVHYLSAGLESV